MSRLSSEVQFLASDILLRHLFREAMLAGEAPPRKLRTMLVIDEAKLLALREPFVGLVKLGGGG